MFSFVWFFFLSHYFFNLTFRRNQASEKWGNVRKVKWQSQNLNPALYSCKNFTFLILYHLYEYSQVLDEYVRSCQALCLQPAKWVRALVSRLVVVAQSGGALGDWGALNPSKPSTEPCHNKHSYLSSNWYTRHHRGDIHALFVILTEIP